MHSVLQGKRTTLGKLPQWVCATKGGQVRPIGIERAICPSLQSPEAVLWQRWYLKIRKIHILNEKETPAQVLSIKFGEIL